MSRLESVNVDFTGVWPALTTPFSEDGQVDWATYRRLAERMKAAGAKGLVPCGSLGEAGTLSFEEKVELVRICAEVLPTAPGVAALSTAEAIRFAEAAQAVGAVGLMVLPPYAYSTDWREMRAHMAAVIDATPLACILYNNPIAYKTDFLPEQIAELARNHANLLAVKESSADIRRLAAIRELIGDRLTLMMGVDDLIVEGVRMGATGWIAGLVNAYPEESVKLFEMARAGDPATDRLYHWFLPLMRLDTVPKFVQLIKLVQHAKDGFPEAVRAPRLALTSEEREATLALVRHAEANRP